MDVLIESCDKRVNEIFCNLKDEIQADTRMRQAMWICCTICVSRANVVGTQTGTAISDPISECEYDVSKWKH